MKLGVPAPVIVGTAITHPTSVTGWLKGCRRKRLFFRISIGVRVELFHTDTQTLAIARRRVKFRTMSIPSSRAQLFVRPLWSMRARFH